VRPAAFAVVLLLFVLFARRWVHHAQLELVPVIVPPRADAQAVVAPPAGAIAARMARDVKDIVSKPVRPRLAVLTFDDGPYPVESSALAAELKDLRVPADFFLIGADVRREPAIARRLFAMGFEIGNHTMTHPKMPALPFGAQSEEIGRGAAAIEATSGAFVRYFRPPHGSYDANTIRAAQTAGEVTVLWDVDPGDWRTLTPRTIASLVIDQAKAPAVILLHNGKDATIEALPIIVGAYRRAGFQFVTLSELERRVAPDDINDPIKVQL
jgi:peptidoglycan/xylan/chitin deacetylase (PgdA/CDA1 family)